MTNATNLMKKDDYFRLDHVQVGNDMDLIIIKHISQI